MTDASPLFILSFRQRDEIAGMAARAGWRPVAARRADGLARRVAASGAAVVVIDARGAIDEGLAAVRALGFSAGGEGRALLVLVSRNDVAALDDFYAAGATHFLVSPMREAEFAHAIRFARRHAERVTGGWVAESRESEPLGWRYDHRQRSLQMTPALARVFDLPQDARAGAMLRRLGADRATLKAAIRRLAATDNTAFAHDLPRVGRVVEHLQVDRRSGRLHALIEPLGETPDAGVAVRDLFPRRARPMAALARDLPGAIERGEIEVLFQPQVEIATGRITGVEALARWRHPRLGEIGAEALFGAALRAGRGDMLSRHLQQRALDAAGAWPAALAHLRVAINVTAMDLAGEGFADTFLALADAGGVARDRVTVELTESELVDELDIAADVLAVLRGAGCRVAIDDFGTGYSSLSYLHALPLDYLKLDKAMTREIAGSERDRVVVRGVIDMAHSLGLAVIAEGVETVDQHRLLAERGCEYYQGFLCAPPLDAAALLDLVTGGASR